MGKRSDRSTPPLASRAEMRRFSELFVQRLAQRPDAVSHLWAEETVLLNGPGNRGVALKRAEGTCVATSLALDVPFVKLVLYGDRLAILGDESAARQMLEDMATMTLMLPADVPFGHVVDGEIHDIIFTRDPGEVKLPDGRPGVASGTNRYVLAGAPRPFPETLRTKTDSTELWATLWDQVDRGELLRLGERLCSQPGEVWLKWNGKTEWLEFDQTDGLSPVLAPNGRHYVGWVYTEDSPCEVGRYYGVKPTEKTLGDWFAK